MKRVVIVHGWGGNPQEGWFPWVKEKLEERGYVVDILHMPHPESPEIASWIACLQEAVSSPDANTSFIAHSIGCQTTLRFIQALPSHTKVGQVVLVAPWLRLTSIATPDEESKEIAKPWINNSLMWHDISVHSDTFTCIFSDNDPFVYIEDAKVFEKELHAEIIIEHNKGHLGEEDNITTLDPLLSLFPI